MQKFNDWRFIAFALLTLLLASACGNLSGDVEIVSTIPPVTENVIPLELPATPPDIANGQRIFQQNCTDCHGVTGEGNGELVVTGEVPRMGSFLDPAHVRQQSVESYYNMISNGNLINLMPPWSEALSVQERWDVAMYVYTLHYSQAQVAVGGSLVDGVSTELQLESDAQLAATSTLEGDDAYAAIAYQRVQSVQNWGVETSEQVQAPQLESVNFSGTVTQGSPGAAFPTNILLELRYGDFLDTTEIVPGTVDASGHFSFTNIPFLENSTYVAVIFYEERAYLSRQINSRDLQENNDLEIILYETTTAPDIVTLVGVDIILEYLTVPDLGEGIVINQINVYDNPTNFIFHLEPEGQNVRVSLLVSLPIGAIILDTPDRNTVIAAQDQYALIDTRPVYPGQHLIETTYFIPYENGSQTLDMVLNNNFAGEVSIIVNNPELSIVSDTIRYTEDINVGSADQPVMAGVYRGTFNLQRHDSLIFDIEGRIDRPGDGAILATGGQILPILAIVVVVVFALFFVLVFYLRGSRSGTQQQIDKILMEISRLESMHDAGHINHDAFQHKRTELKAQLAQLMSESEQNE